MPKRPLLFYIRSTPSTYVTNYYVVSDAGVVSTQTTAKPLRWMPDKEDKLELTWHRDMNHMGIVEQFAAPTRWYGDAAMILRHVVATEGLEFKLQLEVRRLDTTTQLYSLMNIMDFDFTTFRTEELYVTCGCVQGGLHRLIRSRMNTNFEIPITGSQAGLVNMDGIHAKTKYNFVGAVADYESHVVSSLWNGGMQFWPLNFTTKEGEIEVGNAQYVIVNNIANQPKDNYIYKALYDQDVIIRLVGGIIYSCPGSSSNAKLQVYMVRAHVADYNAQNNIGSQLVYSDPNPLTAGQGPVYRDINVTLNISLDAGDVIVITYALLKGIQGGFTTFVSTDNAYVYPDAQMSIEATYRMPTTQPKLYRFRDYMQKLVEKVTDSTLYNFSSLYFQSQWGGASSAQGNWMNSPRDTGITSGNALRGLNDNAIIGSLQNAIRIAQSIGMVGMGIAGSSVIFERLKYFFQDSVTIADVGVVKDAVVTPATDLLVSNVMFGYPDVEFDEINGKYAYNNTSEFTTPLTLVNDTLELTSTANAEPYGIEVLRSRTFNKDTKDTAGDKSTYLITFNSASVTNNAWNLYRPVAGKAGVLFPDDIYNYDITPKLNLKRWGGYLRSLFWQQQAQQLKFVTASKNKNLILNFLGGPAIFETANETINTLDAPFFKPYYFEFECPTPANLYQQMTFNPYGIIKFKMPLTKQGQNAVNPVLADAEGFVIELNVRADRPDMCTMKLLSTINVDLVNILKYGNVVGDYPDV